MHNKPIENCYWVIPGRLLAGEYPRNKDAASSISKMKSFIDAGITTFIDLTHVSDDLASYQVWIGNLAHHKFPIKDYSIPETEMFTLSVLNKIDSCIKNNDIIYVHCWGGSGRTGTIIGCWLVHHGYAGLDALKKLHELWQQCPKSKNNRSSPDNQEQKDYVLNWKTGQ